MAVKKDRRGETQFTVFQEKSFFRGNLNFGKPLQIQGKFEGEITGKNLLEVGPKAEVKAHISTTELIVYGKVIGNVHATERVELHHGASLIGNIKTPNLEIDDGVVFEGQCEMQTRKDKAS